MLEIMDAYFEENLAARPARPVPVSDRPSSRFGSIVRFAYSFDADGVNRWNWRLEDELADACSRLMRNPTSGECEQYIGTEAWRRTCNALQ